MKSWGKNIFGLIIYGGVSFFAPLGQAAGVDEQEENKRQATLNVAVSDKKWAEELSLRQQIISGLSKDDRMRFYDLIRLSGVPADMQRRLAIFRCLKSLVDPEMGWEERGNLFLCMEKTPLEKRDEIFAKKKDFSPQGAEKICREELGVFKLPQEKLEHSRTPSAPIQSGEFPRQRSPNFFFESWDVWLCRVLSDCLFGAED